MANVFVRECPETVAEKKALANFLKDNFPFKDFGLTVSTTVNDFSFTYNSEHGPFYWLLMLRNGQFVACIKDTDPKTILLKDQSLETRLIEAITAYDSVLGVTIEIVK
jgi:hypothetical protein